MVRANGARAELHARKENLAQVLSADNGQLQQMRCHHDFCRDIKPQNIFLTESNKIVKLGDFGVTLELNATLEMARTQVTVIVLGHGIGVRAPI